MGRATLRRLGLLLATAACLGAAAACAETPLAAALGQPTNGPRVLTCVEGRNTVAFLFDGKGGATLSRIEGPEMRAFPDLQTHDWTVRIVTEQGLPRIHVANARGALLSASLSDKPVGHMTWSDPPGAEVDLLCEIAR